MSILNNLNKKSPKKSPNSKFGTLLKIGAGAATAGGLYQAGEFAKNTDGINSNRLHDDFGHVGGVLNRIAENTSVSSSVPMSYLGDKPYPMLTSKSLETVKKIVKRK